MKKKIKTSYSKYLFKHMLFYFEPDVLALPIVLYINKTGVQISTLWFSVVWYWKKQIY